MRNPSCRSRRVGAAAAVTVGEAVDVELADGRAVATLQVPRRRRRGRGIEVRKKHHDPSRAASGFIFLLCPGCCCMMSWVGRWARVLARTTTTTTLHSYDLGSKAVDEI